MPSPSAAIPRITIAVCTRDRPESLADCLEALRAPTAAVRAELLVVDNAPSDMRTRDLVRSLAGVKYVREDLPGLDFARNRALAEATGEVVAFVDDDVVVPPGWLAAVGRVFAEEPDVGILSGPVVPAELETEAQELFERRGGFTQTFEKRRYGLEAPDEWSRPHWPLLAGIFGSGCNLALRTELARRLGGFDDALDVGTPTRGGGDHDMIYWVIAAGNVFAYEPAAFVRHRHRRDMFSLRWQMESWGRGTVAFLVKHALSNDARHRLAHTLSQGQIRRELRPGPDGDLPAVPDRGRAHRLHPGTSRIPHLASLRPTARRSGRSRDTAIQILPARPL